MIHAMLIQEDLWLNLTLESPPLQLTISLEKVKTWRRRMEGWRLAGDDLKGALTTWPVQ